MKKLLFFVLISSLMISFSVSISSCRRDKVIDTTKVNTDKKVGYLFYTGFIDEFNNSLFETFSKFKAAGVNELIVDLRYNRGGSLNAASYLASLIAPRSAVQSKSKFSELDLNTYLDGAFGDDRFDYLGTFKPTESNPLNANLNLSTVYIIATGDSYSASELLTFCLRPYMKVVHIGSETGGKFTASFTVTAYDNYGGRTIKMYDPLSLPQSTKDSLKDWAMQPIIAIYKDSKGNDFSVPGKLIPDVSVQSRENDRAAYKPLGDSTDYLIAAALSKISGATVSAAQNSTTISRSVIGWQSAKLPTGRGDALKQGVIWNPSATSSQVNATASINTVSKFVYDGMSAFYYWSDNMKTKVPTSADNDPVTYFKSVLYPLDTQNGWSWITNDVNSLLADFSGEPVDIGWGLTLLWTDASKTKLIGIVKYVFPNSPAANAGITRGDVITQINSTDMSPDNASAGYYMKLFGSSTINTTILTSSGITKQISLTPVKITTNPVLKDAIYTIKK